MELEGFLIFGIAGVILGLSFRATVLPAAASAVIAIILANAWFRGWTVGAITFNTLGALFAMQAGYIFGLWVGQAWRRRD